MVLIADDSPTARYTLQRELRKAGIEPACVGSLSEALRLDGREVVCALLDLDLGGDSGTALAAHLREQRPEVRIAFFTASRDTELARTFGPVFGKPEALADAVAWVGANARQAGESPPRP